MQYYSAERKRNGWLTQYISTIYAAVMGNKRTHTSRNMHPRTLIRQIDSSFLHFVNRLKHYLKNCEIKNDVFFIYAP